MLPLRDPARAFEPLPLPGKARLAGEILLTYARTRWALSRRELPAALERLRRGHRPSQPLADPCTYRNGVRLGAAVGKVLSPLPTDSRCLARSLVLAALLSRRGIPSSLVIGVRGAPDFGAHAWVEYDGIPLLHDDESTYRRLVEFGADGSLNGHGHDAERLVQSAAASGQGGAADER